MKAPCFNFLEFMLTKLMVIITLMVPTTLKSLHGLLISIKCPQCMLINGCCWIKIKIRWWIVVAYVWWWCLKINLSLIMWNQHLVTYQRCPLMLLLTPIFATYTNIGFWFKALGKIGDGVLPTIIQWLTICWSSPQLHLWNNKCDHRLPTWSIRSTTNTCATFKPKTHSNQTPKGIVLLMHKKIKKEYEKPTQATHTHVQILLSSYGVEGSTIDKMSFNIKGSESPLNKVFIWSPKPRDKLEARP